jgi:hypothetical protein
MTIISITRMCCKQFYYLVSLSRLGFSTQRYYCSVVEVHICSVEFYEMYHDVKCDPKGNCQGTYLICLEEMILMWMLDGTGLTCKFPSRVFLVL